MPVFLKYYPKVRVGKETELFLGLIVIFGLLSAFTTPSFSLGGLGIYLVTIVSPVVFVLTFFLWIKAPSIHHSALFPFALGCMVLLSSMVSWTAGYSSINYRDFIESIKYFQFVPYLLVLNFLGERSLKLIHYFIIYSAILVCLIGFIQFSGLHHGVSYLYLGADSAHINSVISGSRITLTGSDPNIGGIIACFYVIYFFSLFASNHRKKYLIAFFVFFFLCFMTQSRTALIALLFGLASYYILYYKTFFLVKLFLAIFAFSLVFFLVFYLDLSYIYIGIKTALEGKNNSLNVRFENIFNAFTWFLESPFFGIGPAKSSTVTTIDSEYALILQRYGLIGVFLFSSYIIYLLRLAHRNLDSHWGVALFSFTMMTTLVMITNNIFSGYQLMSVVVILNIACVLNQREKGRRSIF